VVSVVSVKRPIAWHDLKSYFDKRFPDFFVLQIKAPEVRIHLQRFINEVLPGETRKGKGVRERRGTNIGVKEVCLSLVCLGAPDRISELRVCASYSQWGWVSNAGSSRSLPKGVQKT
jgi:hypothetical protein